MRARAQIFTWDLIFSLMLFSVVITALFYMLGSTASELVENEEFYDIGWSASMVGEQLVRLPGVPVDWTSGNVRVVGLAEDKTHVGFEGSQGRVISPKKFVTLVGMAEDGYDALKIQLLRSSEYDFYIQFSCRNVWSDPLYCFRNLSAEGAADGVFDCANGLSIGVYKNRTSVWPIDSAQSACVVGSYRPLSEIKTAVSSVKNAVFSESEDLASPEFDGLPSLNKSIEVKVVVYKKNPFAQTTVPTTPLTTVLSTVSTVQPTTLASTSTTTTICPGDECNPEPGVHYCCALGLKCYSGGCCAEAQYCNPVPGTEYCCLPGQECSSTGCCDAAQFCNPAPAIRECCGPAAPSCGPQGCV